MAKKRSPKVEHPDDPPQKQALLLTCMDLRLTDDTTRFMNDFNLTNRYDHLSFAGAAMGVRNLDSADGGHKVPWKRMFFDHLDVAIEKLGREMKDIIILEHLDCGAYKELLPKESDRKKYKKFSDEDKMKEQVKFHKAESHAFAREITAYFADKHQVAEKSLREVKAKLLAGKGNKDDYDSAILLEKNVKGWSKIQVRCYVMDLCGEVTKL